MKMTLSNSARVKGKTRPHHQQISLQLSPTPEPTPTSGQRLADNLAAKVGSWPFLIGQTVVLAGWVGANLTPGIHHWDESPFILLNLVFSFASAYTAPIVLMSQNRQSDIDRQKAANDRQVNLKAARDVELLHEKIDRLSRQLPDLLETLDRQASSGKSKFLVQPNPVPTGIERLEVAKTFAGEGQTRSPQASVWLPQVFKSNFNSLAQLNFLPGNFVTPKNQFSQLAVKQPDWTAETLSLQPQELAIGTPSTLNPAIELASNSV